MSTPSKKQQQPPPYRLIKRPLDGESPSFSPSAKRYKSTGDDFEVRALQYDDKMQTNDEIHQSISVCPVMKVIIDTEVFQRLRYIKQLGTSEFLYDCANHTRFMHSLGVAHLAERMAETIKQEQPNLGATEKDVLCVKLAGLLHDIGHGPYSHLYESFREDALPKFLKEHPDLADCYADCQDLKVPMAWSHELSSLQLIDIALEELGLKIDLDNLDKPLKQIGHGIDANSIRVFKPPGVKDSVLTSRDFVFVKECILGRPLPEVIDKLDSNSFIGRTKPTQEWLYDIVNNRHSGLDVDKIDYFARDHIRTMGTGRIDSKLIEDARVAKALCTRPEKCHRCNGTPGFHFMICYPRKHVEASMNFFKERLRLHTLIYQHKKTVAVESMLCDILCLADPFFRLQSYDGRRFPISRAILKGEFLLRLDDNIIGLIAHSIEPELEEARALCRRYRKHQFYKVAISQPLDLDGNRLDDMSDVEGESGCHVEQDSHRDRLVWDMSPGEIQAGILNVKSFWEEKGENGTERSSLEANDFIVKKYCMHHGRKHENPLCRMRFFDEMNEKLIMGIDSLPEAKRVQEYHYRSIISQSMQKVGIRIICRNPEKKSLVQQFFFQWFTTVGRGDGITPDPVARLNFDEGSDNAEQVYGEADYGQQGILLSQESVDEGDDEESDDQNGHTAQSEFEVSPIPVRRST